MYPPKLLIALFFLFSAPIAMAHPGHGDESVGANAIFHYFIALDHLIPLLTVVGIILFAIMKKRTESKRAIRK